MKNLATLGRRWALDLLRVQLDAYTWYRHRLTRRYFIRGPLRTLNIGTGGGVETLDLLKRGNLVTVIEFDPATAARTRQRLERNGYAERSKVLTSHILNASLDDLFDQIVMCEVLEHIIDDEKAIRRLAGWLRPGGRLVLTTPTALNGQLRGDTLSLEEDGGHVRVGYEGPELDAMLARNGLMTLSRTFNGNPLVQGFHLAERGLRWRLLLPLGVLFSVLGRLIVPLLDLVVFRPFDQLTVAVKSRPAGANPQ